MSELTFSQHLSGLYSARHSLPGATEEADFIAALQNDPAMLAEARARQAGLVAGVTDKCYVSRVHKLILDAALSQVGGL